MLNLLTPEEKKTIKREYRVRTAAVIVAFMFFTTVFAIAGLLPAYFHVAVNLKIKNTDLKNMTVQSEQEGDDSVALALGRTDTILNFIEIEDTTEATLTSIVERALTARPAGVSVTTLSFDTTDVGRVLTLAGSANTRASLIEYSRNLGDQPGFISTSVPAEDLAQANNIDFRLTVRGEF
ncbi:MAG: hypothetical protein WDZ74_01395 [Candidatus Paceibacterota bacterium]